MNIKLLFFAAARDAIGTPALELVLDDSATVGDLRQALLEQYPAIGAVLDHCSIAVDREYSSNERVLYHGAEVGVIPPVSGG